MSDDFERIRELLDYLEQRGMPDTAPSLRDALDRIAARLATAEKERDEAKAVMREVLERYGDYEEFDPLRRFLGLPLWDSTESWQARGEALATPSEESPPKAKPQSQGYPPDRSPVG